MKRFENRTAIVTGGARGMGASHARGFLAEGAHSVTETLVQRAHVVCPYSNATRNKIDVRLFVI